jgi:hypothetical protein
LLWIRCRLCCSGPLIYVIRSKLARRIAAEVAVSSSGFRASVAEEFLMLNNVPESIEFPSLSEIEAARHEILDRVVSSVTGGAGDARAYHVSHSSGTGKGHQSTVSNRPVIDDQSI